MSQSEFKANSWFQPNKENSPGRLDRGSTPLSTSNVETPSPFTLNDCFIPGWKGEGLVSKATITLKKLQAELWRDVSLQLQINSELINKNLKIRIYDEFISFANYVNRPCITLDSYLVFWENLFNKDFPEHKILNDFVSNYSFQVVLTYLFKIRFMVSLSKSMNQNLSEADLHNPSSWISKSFPKGSSLELVGESIQANQYSWYRPGPQIKTKISSIHESFLHISMTEMMKLCCYRGPLDEHTELNFTDDEYSHSLSHKHFGLFINDLLIYLPSWIDPQSKSNGSSDLFPKALTTKFVGDYLSSMTLSHWLAQENNMNEHWSEIIAPDFAGDDFRNGQFVRICHELQFMSYLVIVAQKQAYDPKKLISKIMKEKYFKIYNPEIHQPQLQGINDHKVDTTYSRIVLNLCQLPQKNGHHYLITQIKNHAENLAQDGYLLVLTNQKLFVPSHNSKVDGLLQNLKVECFFDLENLLGKGEISNHLYILRKRDISSSNSSMVTRENCPTFRFEGVLAQFQRFQLFNSEFEYFMRNKCSCSTPIYQKQIDERASFEFYQNAIIDGRLVHQSGQDQGNILHPSFFKNLASACLSLETFFQIESLNPNTYNPRDKKEQTPSDYLGFSFKREDSYPLLMIVDYTNPDRVLIDFCTGDLLRARIEKLGISYYRYFGLIPKFPKMDMNIFKEFFSSAIGQQVVQLSLSGGIAKLKSKVRSLLIPKFFIPMEESEDILSNQSTQLSLCDTDWNSLLATHPEHLMNEFKKIELAKDDNRNPYNYLKALCHFKITLENGLSSFDDKGNDQVNFNNPLILEPLLKLPCFQIMTNNNDVYLEFHVGKHELNETLVATTRTIENGSFALSLMSSNGKIVSFHSDDVLLSFIDFILSSSAHGMPVLSILQGLKVPKIEPLNEVIMNFSLLKQILREIHQKVSLIIAESFTKQISA